ncbi:MAG: hypothetical protein AB7S86_12605 [Hydrogenophaga sp.]|uniref:hypothetical protein n=1 Tax=Hydrogenophaga sp. TaxID=1904254 RepID=UPI003D1416CD
MTHQEGIPSLRHVARRAAWVMLLAVGVWAMAWPALSQPQACSTPLPSDAVIPPPAKADGTDTFLGLWGNGKWQGVLCHTLLVESLAADGTASVVYSHGVHQPWNIRAPGFVRVTGMVKDGTLALTLPNGRNGAEYRLVDGALQGTYLTQGRPVAYVKLTRH